MKKWGDVGPDVFADHFLTFFVHVLPFIRSKESDDHAQNFDPDLLANQMPTALCAAFGLNGWAPMTAIAKDS
ncbi:MAG: hypothetical protein EBW60_04875 [Rhodobacteraceae bacterium]|nr:hypothetical protein [Paracoccaceae bacterium]